MLLSVVVLVKFNSVLQMFKRTFMFGGEEKKDAIDFLTLFTVTDLFDILIYFLLHPCMCCRD